MKAEWGLLLSQWNGGIRSREAALRLLFLSWYSCSEPPYLSGSEGIDRREDFVDELFEFLGGEASEDTEVLFVVAVMAEVAPWCLGDEHSWERIAGIFRSRLKGGVPEPRIFDGGDAYSEYFAHQARVQSGVAI